MRKFYFLFALILGINMLQAQDPDLYRSWDLRVIYYEQGYPIFIDEVEPEVHPYILFNEDNSFIGHSACSQFSGTAIFDADEPSIINFSNVDFPEVDCGNDVLNQIDFTLRQFINNDIFAFWGVGIDSETGNLGFGLQHGFADTMLFQTTLDSELFDTWYLQEIQVEMNPTIYVSEYNPAIAPTLTLNEDLTFEGMAACNSFSGNFNLDEDEDLFFNDFTSTDLNCETEDLNDFEMIYSHLFSGEEHFPMNISYYSATGELSLWFGSSTGIAYRFTKTPLLGTQDFTEVPLKIYPNPTSDFLMVENAKTNSSFQIFDMDGKLISQGKLGSQNKIDVSTLEKGNYILKMNSKNYRFIKK
jgi:heat shock protein HslJ